MILTINGKKTEFADETLKIPELLRKIEVDSPDMVTVEVNGEIIYKASYPTFVIKDGDKIEFLYFMGGGSSLKGDKI